MPLPGSPEIRQLFRDRSRRLQLDSQEIAVFDHKSVIGTTREEALMQPLREVLPERFGIGTGQVVAADGTRAGQNDIIIYDRLVTPVLYRRWSQGLYPVETVLAVISVKSKLESSEIDTVFELARMLHTMKRHTAPLTMLGSTPESDEPPTSSGHWSRPAVFSFGFAGLSWQTLHKAVIAKDSPNEPAPHGLLVLGKGYAVPRRFGRPVVEPRDRQAFTTLAGVSELGMDGGDGLYALFVTHLQAALAAEPGKEPSLAAYLGGGAPLIPKSFPAAPGA